MNKKIIIVIGGGPAGLMAAGQASLRGANVILLEKKSKPALKLGITGKGRCNLTNKAPLNEFLKKFGPAGRFLKPSFSSFFTEELIRFFRRLNVDISFERGGRVFPSSDDALQVVRALTKWAKDAGVAIQTDQKAEKFAIEDGAVTGIRARSARTEDSGLSEYPAQAVIVAAGGASYPSTGSDGDGYRLAKSAGHSIVPVRPALVPLVTEGDTAQRLQGLSLRNVNVKLISDGKRIGNEFGEMIFTHFGVSGPVILTLSKLAVDSIREKKKTSISIDLKPALDDNKLDSRILRDFDSHGTKSYGSILKGLLPRKLIPVCADLTGIPMEKTCHQITSGERKKLRLFLKNLDLQISDHRSFSEAIITAGGVALKEVDPKTMQSRIISGLYFAGEILDIDACTGGFNLQAAFSTGYLAGISAGAQ